MYSTFNNFRKVKVQFHEPVDPDVGMFPQSGAPVLQSRSSRLVYCEHPHQSGVVRERASGSSHTQQQYPSAATHS